MLKSSYDLRVCFFLREEFFEAFLVGVCFLLRFLVRLLVSGVTKVLKGRFTHSAFKPQLKIHN